VAASAVVAFEGPNGPEPLAVIVPRRRDADIAAVVERANRFLAEHQRMRRWFVWPDEDFPRTGALKVRKGLVAARATATMAGVSGPTALAASAGSGALEDIISRVGTEPGGKRDASATLGHDLNLDSLGRIELLSALEDRYQIEIDEAAFTGETTLADVERMVRAGAREEGAPYPYPRWQDRAPLNWLRIALLYALVLPFTRLLGRPQVIGREQIAGVSGPVVFIANHVTVVDAALVLYAAPARLRGKIAMAMDGEVLRALRHPPSGTPFWKRILGPLEYALAVLFFSVFSMPRKSGFRRSFAFAGELVDRGKSILVFPEGKYTTTGSIDRFMVGTGMLISELGVPVVPMRLDGLWPLKQAKRRHATPGEITVRIGEPVAYSPHDTAERIVSDLEKRIAAL
jgi:long-chain acyl-CoA synthetase